MLVGKAAWAAAIIAGLADDVEAANPPNIATDFRSLTGKGRAGKGWAGVT